MTLQQTVVILLTTTALTASQSCTRPALPLAASFTPSSPSSSSVNMTAGSYSCQAGFVGVGSPELSCLSGRWSGTGFLCSTNVARLKPSFYNSNSSLPASSLAVDGRPGSSELHCERLDNKHKVFTVDLRETLNVVAVRIFTHNNGRPVNSIEIRVGDDVDHSENRMCWFVPSLKQGGWQIFQCPEVVGGRYVSLSLHSPPHPLYLCELEVLCDAREQVSAGQCGGAEVHANTCLTTHHRNKLSFTESLELCQQNNMSIIHNHTLQGGTAYSFVRDFFQEVSRTTRQRMLVWVGMERQSNESWHWVLQGDQAGPGQGPEVESYDWGAREPGQVGSCVVMDSSLRWSWNAIGCVISAYVGCHGPPRWCPSPYLGPGVVHSLNTTNTQSQYNNGVSLQLTCIKGYAGSPAQFAITRCAEGFWSPYSLQCSPHDCGPLLSGPGLALTVSYPDNTTQLGSQATLSCSLGEIQRETSLTCTKEGWSGLRPSCDLPDLRIEQTEQTPQSPQSPQSEESEEEAEESPVSLGSTGGPAVMDNHCFNMIILAIFIVRAL